MPAAMGIPKGRPRNTDGPFGHEPIAIRPPQSNPQEGQRSQSAQSGSQASQPPQHTRVTRANTRAAQSSSRANPPGPRGKSTNTTPILASIRRHYSQWELARPSLEVLDTEDTTASTTITPASKKRPRREDKEEDREEGVPINKNNNIQSIIFISTSQTLL